MIKEEPGKFTLRLPKALHPKVVDAARKEGVSTNMYIVSLLAAEIGRVEPVKKASKKRK